MKIRLKSYHHIFYQSHSFDLVRYILSKIVAMVTNHGYKKLSFVFSHNEINILFRQQNSTFTILHILPVTVLFLPFFK